jgi:hypothetical protein
MVAFVPANLDQNDVKKKWNQNKLGIVVESLE